MIARIAACLLAAMASFPAAANCRGTVFLTFDTGHMEPAASIADMLDKHGVKATFFLANEKTKRAMARLMRRGRHSGSAWPMPVTPSARIPGATGISRVTAPMGECDMRTATAPAPSGSTRKHFARS